MWLYTTVESLRVPWHAGSATQGRVCTTSADRKSRAGFTWCQCLMNNEGVLFQDAAPANTSTAAVCDVVRQIITETTHEGSHAKSRLNLGSYSAWLDRSHPLTSARVGVAQGLLPQWQHTYIQKHAHTPCSYLLSLANVKGLFFACTEITYGPCKVKTNIFQTEVVWENLRKV